MCAVCGGEHPALLSEHELDCGPVTPRTDETFVNVLTGKHEPVAEELTNVAELHLRRGNWPWTFYCACEHEVRPGYPSHLARVEPGVDDRTLGVAVRCACCGGLSINLVSPPAPGRAVLPRPRAAVRRPSAAARREPAGALQP